MLKADLHIPAKIPSTEYRTMPRFDRASRGARILALAVTLHDRQLPLTELTAIARDRGVVLVPGIERTIRGKHVLMLNFPPAAEQVSDFDELARLRRRTNGLSWRRIPSTRIPRLSAASWKRTPACSTPSK
jgi:predicted metal-dependent phosphoesterase TrpH